MALQAALKALYHWGIKRKDRKMWKSKSEEKVVGFSSVFLFPTRKQEAVTQGKTRGIEHLMRRITQGAGMVKSWGGQARLWVHSKHI